MSCCPGCHGGAGKTQRVRGTPNSTWNEWGILERACDLGEEKVAQAKVQGHGRAWNYKSNSGSLELGTGWR